jgi:hypothetical protein
VLCRLPWYCENMINRVIRDIVASQQAARRHAVVLAYLAGHITRDERDLLIWRISVGLPT